MKFKELPEGLYQITDVNHSSNTVFVQPLENPDAIPLCLFIPEPIEVVNDGRSYNGKGYFFPKNLDDMDVDYKTFGEVQKERKSRGASISHVTRRLNANEPLTGKTLELALSLIGEGSSGDQFYDGIANKLISGQPLSEYEHHIMVDVRLVHARVSG